ncbi:MAG: DUF4422 domain-containing protein [Lachnospiraceae bacterium]|nr:DUF4422 domain-containing protein [Lachnospiraceae bacterium]MDY2759930.1 DUF4422 domain-containing protein [Lachnospiraceae bacterium]
MKIIVFGIGQALKKRIGRINISDVVCFTDNSVASDGMMYGRPLVSPDQLEDFDYDLIVISSFRFFNEIKSQLIDDLKVPEQKITGIENYLGTDDNYQGRVVHETYISDLFDALNIFNVKSVLDYGEGLVEEGFLDKTDIRFERLSVKVIQITGTRNKTERLSCDLYDREYDLAGEAGYNYDAGINLYRTVENELLKHCSYVFRFLPSDWRINRDVHITGRIVSGYFTDVEVIENKEQPDIAMYVVGHRDFRLKSRSSVYKRIMAGVNRDIPDGYISDMAGDSISSYNEKINELTALYWIWKNTNDDIVGLCHYRRYFSTKDGKRILRENDIKSLLEKYDVIVTNSTLGKSQENIIKYDVGDRVYDEAYRIIRKHLGIKQGKYLDTFEYVMHSDAMYPCHMFITRRVILDRYCEFLFSFITDAADEFDISGKKGRARRTIGFFAERMLTVWLLKQDYHICQLPVKFFEDM